MARPRDLVVNTIIVSLTVLLIFGLVRLLTIITRSSSSSSSPPSWPPASTR